jgi:transposase
MLNACGAQTDVLQDVPPTAEPMQAMRDLIARMQAELEFKQTKIEALNFEIARLKRWRFGSSSESLDGTTQAVLFDAIVADTALEDLAAQGKTEPSAPRAKGQAVRQALPASLPRVERHHEIAATHCACGQALRRIGEEVSNSTACRHSSSCCATSAASTPARAARRSRPRRCPHR